MLCACHALRAGDEIAVAIAALLKRVLYATIPHTIDVTTACQPQPHAVHFACRETLVPYNAAVNRQRVSA